MLIVLIIVLLIVFGGVGGGAYAVQRYRYTRHPNQIPCPDCDQPLPPLSRHCPHCGSQF